MLIESLAQKTRLALMTVVIALAGSTVLCGFTLWRCLAMVSEERSQIYVLDGDIPFLAERAKLEANFMMEAQAHIQLFHHSINMQNEQEIKGTKENVTTLYTNVLQRSIKGRVNSLVAPFMPIIAFYLLFSCYY